MYQQKNLLQEKCETAQSVLATEQAANFFAVLSEAGNWRLSMFEVTRQRSSVPKLLRCDKPGEIMQAHIAAGRAYSTWADVVASKGENASVYACLNATNGTGRQRKNLRTLRALYVDVDHHKEDVFSGVSHLAADALLWRFDHDGVPLPFVNDTGRGLHLIWFINDLGRGVGDCGLKRWERAEKGLIAYVQSAVADLAFLESWEVDSQVSDPTRLIRLPGSYNFSSKTYNTVLWGDSRRVSLEAIEEALGFDDVAETAPVKKECRIASRKKFYPRGCVQKLIIWAQDRDFAITGHRNQFFTILASYMMLESGHGDVLAQLLTVNNWLAQPLRDSEVAAIYRACRRKGGYRYRYKTIIRALGMNDQEARVFRAAGGRSAWAWHIATGQPFKHGPNATRDRLSRERAKIKFDTYKQFRELHRQGKNAEEIAKMFGVTPSAVRHHWNDDLMTPSEKRYWEKKHHQETPSRQEIPSAVQTPISEPKPIQGKEEAPKNETPEQKPMEEPQRERSVILPSDHDREEDVVRYSERSACSWRMGATIPWPQARERGKRGWLDVSIAGTQGAVARAS